MPMMLYIIITKKRQQTILIVCGALYYIQNFKPKSLILE